MTGSRLLIRGQVQGVGFRPAVWRLARAMGLTGDVRNTAEGVEVRVWGTGHDAFSTRLVGSPPALARIDAIETSALTGPPPCRGFEIVATEDAEMQTSITPDAATCAGCRAEVLDPSARRYRYPFANCTDCGPRFSILRQGPYDRAHTTMAGFALCPACATEYGDPADRRFHAQPIACSACGPRVWLEDFQTGGLPPGPFDGVDEADAVAAMLLEGRILAIKGIGGVHLACDATNADAVRRLRHRKHRIAKPFALMARDLEVIAAYAQVAACEAATLRATAAPIVLLKARDGTLPAEVAPGLDRVGFMLPHTPLHHLILERIDTPLVMTSGNLSGTPQCCTNDEVRERLAGIADLACLHDRDIANRIDDSVVRVDLGRPRILRRARGYAPRPLPLPPGFDPNTRLLAMGSQLKNTFCLVRNGQATLSQHNGDMEDAGAADALRSNLRLFENLFRSDPQIVAVDAHPDYLPTRLGREIAGARPVIEVQHHHAHIAACLAENGHPCDAGPVLGIALDGLGLGPDGTIWGGELLIATYAGCRRAGCLRPVALPGGTAAVRDPWRNAYAHLAAGPGWAEVVRDFPTLEVIQRLSDRPLKTLDAMIRTGLNSPLSSSCGRLFDAAAALTGLAWERQDFEGQAAMLFEATIDRSALRAAEDHAYPFALREPEHGRVCAMIDPADMWRTLLADLARAAPPGTIAARFHLGLADAIVDLAAWLCRTEKLSTVALSGGCFQNATLLRLVHDGLSVRGLTVLTHSEVPTNDGGLSLGQAAVALARHQARDQQGEDHVPGHTGTDR